MKDRHKKEKKSTRKHHRILWVFAFFLVVGIGVTAYILLFSAYTRWVERETTATGTVQEEIYSFKSRRDLLSLTPEVKRAALYGRATEIDYGTYIIPGLNATETQVFGEKNTSSICTSMTPQGLAVTEDYLLVTAYCHTNTHNSVIYIIDKKTHEFVKEIVLRNKSHVGGIAYDTIHNNIWISCMSRGIPQVTAITLDQLKNYRFQDDYQPISYSQSYDLYAITRNSFLTYYNNALYIGYYTSNSASVLEEYDITEDGTLQTSTVDDATITTGQLGVDSLTPLALPSGMRVITERAQGVAFYKNRILTSHSYGVLPGSLKVFPNSLQMLLEEGTMLQKIRFPSKLEQIYVDGDDLYVLFESAAYGYRYTSLTQFDRILKLNLNTLLADSTN